MVSGVVGWSRKWARWRHIERMTDQVPVCQLRLCITAPDHDEALRFYRDDILGLPESASDTSPGDSGQSPRRPR
jgi:hypothetical protein